MLDAWKIYGIISYTLWTSCIELCLSGSFYWLISLGLCPFSPPHRFPLQPGQVGGRAAPATLLSSRWASLVLRCRAHCPRRPRGRPLLPASSSRWQQRPTLPPPAGSSAAPRRETPARLHELPRFILPLTVLSLVLSWPLSKERSRLFLLFCCCTGNLLKQYVLDSASV